MAICPTNSSQTIFRYGFYFSLLFFFYGTLFPFDFDFSTREIARAGRHASLLPYWDSDRGRIPSVPDSVANILLTLPLGFLGFLHRSEKGRVSRVWNWGALGLVLGLTAEILQLAVPSRSSTVTDALNNCVGALAGAALARAIGSRLKRFLAGTALDREHTYLWLAAGGLLVFMFTPFDFSLDVSQIISDFRLLRWNPWELGKPVSNGWLQMAGFMLVAALAARIATTGRLMHMTRARAAFAVLVLLPAGLEFCQLVVASHAPSLRDLAMGMTGTAAGWMAGSYLPALARPFPGFILVSLAIVLTGLSPYRFVDWQAASSFQWIPFLEYYGKTNATALSDAMTGFVEFGLVAGLMRLSCPECPRWLATGCATALAAGIEIAQLFIPSRWANITDILIAGLGAWAGSIVCAEIEFTRKSSELCRPITLSTQPVETAEKSR
jgi:VanZ family protein